MSCAKLKTYFVLDLQISKNSGWKTSSTYSKVFLESGDQMLEINILLSNHLN